MPARRQVFVPGWDGQTGLGAFQRPKRLDSVSNWRDPLTIPWTMLDSMDQLRLGQGNEPFDR